MKRLLIAAVVAFMAAPVIAAEVPVTELRDGGFAWESMDGQTTSSEAAIWRGGCLHFHMQGTYDGQITVQSRPYAYSSAGALITTTVSNIDVDAAPDGLFFTSATQAMANLPKGEVDLYFDSAGGGTMDADLIVTPFTWGCRD